MSSATSTKPLAKHPAALAAASSEPKESGAFRPWQFFLLAGMLAATATVVVATGQSPASIVLLSATVVAASFVGLTMYRSLAPLVSPEAVQTPTMLAGRTRAALERDKALVLRAIKELEFDYAMKKVGKTDYDEMMTRLRARALRLMRELEAGEGYRNVIEKELQARLGSTATAAAERSGGASAPPSAAVERGGRAFLSAGASAKAEAPADGVLCASCDTTNDPDAKFCKNCGSKLEALRPA